MESTIKCPVCGEQHTLAGDATLQCSQTGAMITLAIDSQTMVHDQSHASDQSQLLDQTSQHWGEQTLSRSKFGRSSILSQLTDNNSSDANGTLTIAAEKYSEVEPIATGGMGQVILARDHDLNRQVAMKTVLPKLTESRLAIGRFIREAQIVGQLEHPNIVPLYDIGMQSNGELFFTMKFVQGRTLAEIIDDLKQGVPRSSCGVQLAETSNDHSATVRCDRICSSEGSHTPRSQAGQRHDWSLGEVIVMDWGLAKRIEETDPETTDEDQIEVSELGHEMTRDGSLMGTPNYMAPEQAQGETATPQTDLYSIGVIMYQLFGLELPHQADSLKELMKAIQEDPPANIGAVTSPYQGKVPIEIQYILWQTLKKDPAERHQSAAELKATNSTLSGWQIPIVCPHTAMKCVATSLSKEIDNHPLLIAFEPC